MTAAPGSHFPAPLARLAHAAGVATEWTDAFGHPHHVPAETLERILTALGFACGTRRDIDAGLAALRAPKGVPALITTDAGGEVVLPGVAPSADAAIEAASPRRLILHPHRDGAAFEAPAEVGYHLIRVAGHTFQLAVAPRRAPTVRALTGRARAFGAAAQVYGLKAADDGGFGHLGAVAELAERLARHGAQALALSPLHALFSAMPERFSPYAPSSRVALNPLLADPAAIFPPQAIAAARGDAAADRQEAAGLIDWPGASRARLAVFRALFGQLDAHPDTARSFAAYAAGASLDLRRHALFETLHGAMVGAARGVDWRDWPAPLRSPDGSEVAAFAAAQADEVRFHLFLQWLADRSLASAQVRARAAGMGIGLIADLAVGLDPAGSQTWSRPDDHLSGLSIGAPPDLLNRSGQNWRLTALSPAALSADGFSAFLAAVRAALRHGGGLRIDHILGLRRLWLVPDGARPGEGAYLDYPLKDLLRLLAIEAKAHRALVIGEDLGTVPEGLRNDMRARGILGLRVLLLERDAAGGFTPPAEWEPETVGMTSTHDLPTLAGWWHGRDLSWRARLAGTDIDPEAREARESERRAFAATAPRLRSGDAQDVVDAGILQVAQSPSALALVPMEDLLGLEESPNLPGSLDEHPNWRRRMPAPAAKLLAEPRVAARLGLLHAIRGRGSKSS